MANEKKRNPKRKAEGQEVTEALALSRDSSSSSSSEHAPKKHKAQASQPLLSSSAAPSPGSLRPSVLAFSPFPSEEKSELGFKYADLQVQQAMRNRNNLDEKQQSSLATKMFVRIKVMHATSKMAPLTEMLMEGADPHFVPPDSKKSVFDTALEDANTPPAVISLLLKYGNPEKVRSKLQEKDQDGATFLAVCAARHHLELVKHLVEVCKQDVTAKDKFGRTVLHRAASSVDASPAADQESVVSYLITRGAETYAQDNLGNTPLNSVRACDDIPRTRAIFSSIVVPLVLKDAKQLIKPNRMGRMPLQWVGDMLKGFPQQIKTSAERETLAAMRIILQQPDVANIINQDPQHPFQYVQVAEVADRLLQLGVSPHFVTKEGKTIFHNRSAPVLRLLCSRSNIDSTKYFFARDHAGNHPVHDLFDQEANLFLQHRGFPLPVKNNFGQTPLHTINWSSPDGATIFNDLIKKNLRPEIQDNLGNTALHIALAWFNRQIELDERYGKITLASNINFFIDGAMSSVIAHSKNCVSKQNGQGITPLIIAEGIPDVSLFSALYSGLWRPSDHEQIGPIALFRVKVVDDLKQKNRVQECHDFLLSERCSQDSKRGSIKQLRKKTQRLTFGHNVEYYASHIFDPAELATPVQSPLYSLVADFPEQLTVLPPATECPDFYLAIFMEAAIHGNKILIRQILDVIKTGTGEGELPAESFITVDTVSADEASNGVSALCLAAMYGHDEIVAMLLDANADFYRSCQFLSAELTITPLCLAAQYGHLAVAQLLLARAKRKSLDITNTTKAPLFMEQTPLMLAAKSGCVEMVTLLLGEKVEVDARQGNGPTALACAVKRAVKFPGDDHCLQIVQELVSAGAQIVTYYDAELGKEISISDIVNEEHTSHGSYLTSSSSLGTAEYFRELQMYLTTPTERLLQELLCSYHHRLIITGFLKGEVIFPKGFSFASFLEGGKRLTPADHLRELLGRLMVQRELHGSRPLFGERYQQQLEKLTQIQNKPDEKAGAKKELRTETSQWLNNMMIKLHNLDQRLMASHVGVEKFDIKGLPKFSGRFMAQSAPISSASSSSSSSVPLPPSSSSSVSSQVTSDGTFDPDETSEEAAGAKSAQEFVQQLPIG